MFDGQSLIYAPVWLPSWPDQFMATRVPQAESFRVGVGGTTIAQRTATLVDRAVDSLVAPSDREVWLINDAGTSDLLADRTAAQMIVDFKTYNDGRRAAGADIIAMPTIVPAGTLTGPQNTQRLAFNAALLADPAAAGADIVVDVAGIPELQDTDDTDWYYDTLHFTTEAAALVAALWNSVVG